MASRVRSLVGRISRPAGASSRRPRRSPPTSLYVYPPMSDLQMSVPPPIFHQRVFHQPAFHLTASLLLAASVYPARHRYPASPSERWKYAGLRPGLRLCRAHIRLGRLVAPIREELRDLFVQHPLRHFLSAPGPRSSSWNGPYDTRISRFTFSPMPSSARRTSRFFPSASVTSIQPLDPVPVQPRFDRPICDAFVNNATRSPSSSCSMRPYARAR